MQHVMGLYHDHVRSCGGCSNGEFVGLITNKTADCHEMHVQVHVI